MGRNKVNIRISPYLRDCLQNFANNQATIETMIDYFKDAEYGEVTESMYSWAETVCEKLCSELNIKGKADEEIIASEYYVCESENRLTEQGKLFKTKDGE